MVDRSQWYFSFNVVALLTQFVIRTIPHAILMRDASNPCTTTAIESLPRCHRLTAQPLGMYAIIIPMREHDAIFWVKDRVYCWRLARWNAVQHWWVLAFVNDSDPAWPSCVCGDGRFDEIGEVVSPPR
jgi:hypothetical protein